MADEPKTRRGRPRPAAPTTPDPVEMAMEAAAGNRAPEGAALEVLRTNAALMREQIGLARNERFRNRIKAVRDGALTVAVLLLIGGAGAFVWSASQARGLVIQPLSVPPGLEADGITGTAVASQLLDRLNAMQAATDTARAADTYENNWAGDVSVEIPSTGVSVGELNRWLRGAIGRETAITGEVTRRAGGLAMTVRTDRTAGRTVVAPDGDLDRLLQASAEAIYEDTQPYRYAQYLTDQERPEERQTVLRRLAANGTTLDRAWAWVGLGNDRVRRGDLRGGAAGQREATRLQPDLALAWRNLAVLEHRRGRAEASLAADRTALPLWRDRSIRHVDARVAALGGALTEASMAKALGDYAGAAVVSARAADLPDWANNRVLLPLDRADALAGAHDTTAARRLLDQTGNRDAAWILVNRTANELAVPVPTLTIARAAQDWAMLEREAAAADAAAEGKPLHRAARTALIHPLWAEALARLGRWDEAQALLAPMPNDCVPCLRARGRIAAFQGENAAADRWFALAVRAAPSSPFAYAERGEAKLARGDAAAAIALFRQAHEKGPRWADPLKFWGDALAAQGDHRGAIRKYRAAARFAPRWGALHLAWGKALAAQGRADAAREKYRQAARLDLSGADRAEVSRLLAVR